MHDSTVLLILAAGVGSHFGGDKQIFTLSSLNLPILAFSLQDAIKNNITHAVVVTRSDLPDFFNKNIFPHFPAIHFDCVFQDRSIPPLPPTRTKPWNRSCYPLRERIYSQQLYRRQRRRFLRPPCDCRCNLFP